MDTEAEKELDQRLTEIADLCEPNLVDDLIEVLQAVKREDGRRVIARWVERNTHTRKTSDE